MDWTTTFWVVSSWLAMNCRNSLATAPARLTAALAVGALAVIWITRSVMTLTVYDAAKLPMLS